MLKHLSSKIIEYATKNNYFLLKRGNKFRFLVNLHELKTNIVLQFCTLGVIYEENVELM